MASGDGRTAHDRGAGGAAREVEATAPTVRCEAVTRFYRSPAGETHALRGVDAHFDAGTVSCVVGPSGSGKSSLLAVLALREVPDGGQVWLAGARTVPAPRGARRRWRRDLVAWAPQRATEALLPHLSAADHVRHVARVRPGAAGADPVEVLAEVGLADRRRALPARLSGGEQQRLAVALACLGDPPLVVADEPTAELDDDSAALVLARFRRAAAAGSCVVVSTHDARVTTAAERVLLLRHGVLSTDARRGGGAETVIDSTGRLQLPPHALRLFPDGRAVLVVDDAGVRVVPPGPRP
ncbi:ABC transporter ATP-binding protein [Aquipuribacter sp. SD81]|uniref:ABC transporter ATP-binding protein n=1 Tax=Aquipuribacter sp. SD81 TaxID=3127703 RepID=UPI003019BB64